MIEWKRCVGIAAVVAMFAALALLFVPRFGIEVDEALVGNAIYARGAPSYSWNFGEYELPIMLINYLGALKAWLYAAVFAVWAPGAYSLRVPMIIAGAASVWLFFALLDRTVGRRAAWIGALLLATDTTFILMHAADYGPVALQFALKLGAMLLFIHFHSTRRLWALALAFFLLGLALWDKAVFGWVLCGLALGALLAFPREIRRQTTPRNLAIASAAFVIGALPLVIYNIARPLDTFRSNVKVAHEPILNKADMLARTVDGYVLQGFMISVDPGPQPGEPRHWYQSGSLKLAELTRYPLHNLILPALALAVVALGFLWRTPARAPLLFSFGAVFGTWLPMALTAGAGAAAQHSVLVYPFHLMAIATVLSRIPARWAWIAAIVLCIANLGATNTAYASAIRNGGGVRWTDAIYPLDRYLASQSAERVFVADWGMFETINLLSQGRTPILNVDRNDRAALRRMLENPNDVFVAHTAEYSQIPEIRAALEAEARAENYREERTATIFDRNGRAVFEIFRFRKVHL
jgi:hypothetical protein